MIQSQYITIPASLLPQLEAWGQLTTKLFGELRRQTGLPPAGTPKSQAWFWTKEWQAGEREADEALAQGKYVEFDNIEDAIAELHRHV